MNEIWKDVVGYEGLYQVSNLGRIKSFKMNSPKILKPSEVLGGYHQYALYKKGICKRMKCHRIVAFSFLLNKYKKSQINHKNGVKTDNCVENLEWVTPSENMIHSDYIEPCGAIAFNAWVSLSRIKKDIINNK